MRSGADAGFRWLAAGLGLAGGLLLVEAGLRLAGLGYGNVPFDPDPILHHVNPRNYRFVSYSPHGEYGGFEVSFNGAGWRELPRPSSPEVPYRFALMGDSFAAGLEVPVEESLAGRLAILGQNTTEVRNFGVTSYSPVLESLQWDREVAAFRPTHVLLLLYANDPGDDETYAGKAVQDAAGKIVAVPFGEAPWLRQLSRHSYLVRLLRKRMAEWSRREEAGTAVGGFVEPDAELGGITQKSLRELRVKVEKSGARFYLSAVPSKAKISGLPSASGLTFSDRARAWAEGEGVEFIDLTPTFTEASQHGALYFPKDIHWNSKGNRLAAEAVARRLTSLFPHPSRP